MLIQSNECPSLPILNSSYSLDSSSGRGMSDSLLGKHLLIITHTTVHNNNIIQVVNMKFFRGKDSLMEFDSVHYMHLQMSCYQLVVLYAQSPIP